MRKAIETRFHCATNFKSSRVSARAVSNKPVFLAMDYELNDTQNHATAAKCYAERKNWPGLYVGGYVAGSGYIFVNTGLQSRHDIAGHSCRLHPLGVEGEDWFFVEERP